MSSDYYGTYLMENIKGYISPRNLQRGMTGEGCSDDDPTDNRAYINLKNKIAGAVSLDGLVDDELVDEVIQAIMFCHKDSLSEDGKLNGASKRAGGFYFGKFYIRSDYSPPVLKILERTDLIVKHGTTIDSLHYRRFKKKAYTDHYIPLVNSGYFGRDSKNGNR